MPTRRDCLAACPTLALLGLWPMSPHARPSPVIHLRGVTYLHRWSAATQHEFTPADQPDLQRWRDMVTVNVHRSVTGDEQLAQLANGVLGNYQRHGRILRTASVPRTPQRPAEHFIAAALGDPRFIEAAFARCVLADGVGYVIVASHRHYGAKVGPEAAAWLQAEGARVEQALMALDRWPRAEELAQLPGSAQR